MRTFIGAVAVLLLANIAGAEWVEHVVMDGTSSRRAVQVLVGEFMGTDYPEGDVDVIAAFRGSPETNPPQVGRIGAAYDYY